jgi:uncharacterized protein (TIGR02996 family)
MTVTTEDDFQQQLDANPDDWQTRLVFADWLQERDDPRADGYRALAAIGRRAKDCQMAADSSGRPGPLKFIFGDGRVTVQEFLVRYGPCMIPLDWFDLLPPKSDSRKSRIYWKYFDSRREADDTAARVFANLPAARRAELLAVHSELR